MFREGKGVHQKPPGLVEDEVDTYEALVLAGRVSALSNEVPALLV